MLRPQLLSSMELRHLRYFVAVAETENVTRAAAKLRIAQPAVSRQIRDLEDELGVPLLERNAKSVRLTEAGRLFLQEAREVLARADAAVVKVQAASGRSRGELHVGYAPSLTARILPRALRQMQAEFPQIRVLLHDLSSEEMLAQLREGKLHVALMVEPAAPQLRGMRFRELARYALRVAAAPKHPLTRSRSVTHAQLSGLPLVGYSRADYPEYHQRLADLFTGTARPPQIVEEHDSVTSLIAAVEAGRGVALLPECVACLVGERLEMIPITPEPPPVIVGAVCRQRTELATVEDFVNAAVEEPPAPSRQKSAKARAVVRI